MKSDQKMVVLEIRKLREECLICYCSAQGPGSLFASVKQCQSCGILKSSPDEYAYAFQPHEEGNQAESIGWWIFHKLTLLPYVSGGHTTEILRLLGSLSQKYSPRHYVLADSDKMSEEKIRSFEQRRTEMFSDCLVSCHIPPPICFFIFWMSSIALNYFSEYW